MAHTTAQVMSRVASNEEKQQTYEMLQANYCLPSLTFAHRDMYYLFTADKQTVALDNE